MIKAVKPTFRSFWQLGSHTDIMAFFYFPAFSLNGISRSYRGMCGVSVGYTRGLCGVTGRLQWGCYEGWSQLNGKCEVRSTKSAILNFPLNSINQAPGNGLSLIPAFAGRQDSTAPLCTSPVFPAVLLSFLIFIAWAKDRIGYIAPIYTR